MTNNETISLARLSIRHQDYRLRCLIRDIEKKSKRAIQQSIEDIESKAALALEAADKFDKEDDDEAQADLASFLHYAASYKEKMKQLQDLMKTKSDAMTAAEAARAAKKEAHEEAKIERAKQRLEKLQGAIEKSEKKLEDQKRDLQASQQTMRQPIATTPKTKLKKSS